jgi:hypothetical protein
MKIVNQAFLAIGLLSVPIVAAAQQQRTEINFLAVTLTGRPVAGQVMQRRGAGKPDPVGRLDARGTKKVTDITCVTGLQFLAESRYPFYIYSGEWRDCEYGEIKFVFNETVIAKDYREAIESVNRLALTGQGDLQLTALFAAGAFERGDFGNLAFGMAQLRTKAPSEVTKGFELVEKDSLARSLGVKNGIILGNNGEVTFTAETQKTFSDLTKALKVPPLDINSMEVRAYIAKEDFLSLQGAIQ